MAACLTRVQPTLGHARGSKSRAPSDTGEFLAGALPRAARGPFLTPVARFGSTAEKVPHHRPAAGRRPSLASARFTGSGSG
jgi:hypothetical protein